MMQKKDGKNFIFKRAVALLATVCMLSCTTVTVFAENETPNFSKDVNSNSIVIGTSSAIEEETTVEPTEGTPAEEENGKFKDITRKTHSWAIDAVNAMTEKGIINGTSATTFSPDNEVTKIQALLLISRMLGYNDDVIQNYINTIYALYEPELSSLSTVYKKELAFLIYNGAFSAEDIIQMNLEDSLTREEAALFLAKSDQADIDNYNIKSNSLYADNSSIASEYEKSVYYVSEKGYMNGVGNNLFGPASTVTRAQIATMLYRVIEKTNITYSQAVIDSVKPSSKTVSVFVSGKTYELGLDVTYRNKGAEIDIEELYSNLYCIVTYEDGVMVQLDSFFEPAIAETVVDGKISQLPTSSTSVKITDLDTNEEKSYKWADRYTVIIKGEEGSVSQLRKYDYVVLELNKLNEIIKLEVMETESVLKDLIIKEIVVTAEDAHLIVTDKDKNEYKYEITATADIRKNGSEIEFTSLGKGDKISKLSLAYNRVKSVDAYSEITSTRGTITTIHISTTENYIVLSNGTEESKFDLNKNTGYYVYGEAKTLYDLELDQYAAVTLDGALVSKIEVSAAAATATNIVGTVIAVNTAANIVSVQTADGTVVIYISKKANSQTKIIDNNATTATNRTLSDIKEGATITAIGTSEAGYFTASTIVYSNN